MAAEDPDLKLVLAAQGGDEGSFGELMTRHQDALFRFVIRHQIGETEAVELVQETFVRAWFALPRFQPSAKFSSWLYRITLNLCRDRVKSRHSRRVAFTDSLDETPDLVADGAAPDEQASADERARHLETGIAALPIDLSAAFVLAVLEGKSHDECAELLGTTAKGVETRVYRARKRLLEWMTSGGF
jgi:RNA polymerase sigma factor (sigma-70 family)